MLVAGRRDAAGMGGCGGVANVLVGFCDVCGFHGGCRCGCVVACACREVRCVCCAQWWQSEGAAAAEEEEEEEEEEEKRSRCYDGC